MKPSIQDQHNASPFITNISTQRQIRIKFLDRYFALPLKRAGFQRTGKSSGEQFEPHAIPHSRNEVVDTIFFFSSPKLYGQGKIKYFT